MGTGGFKQPPKGPEIGPEKDVSELPEAKKAELGDLAKLVAEPAKPESGASAERANIEDLPPADGPDRSAEGAERLEALQSVLAREAADASEPSLDPDELAIEEAAEPTVEQRQAFLRCVLGSKPYVWPFELFGGALSGRMVDISTAEMDNIFAQLTVDQRSGRIETVDDWNTELDRYRMVKMIDKLNWGGKPWQPRDLALPKQLCELMEQFNGTVTYRALLRVARIFQRHLDKLVEGALDSDFWEVGGLDLPSEPTSEEPSTTKSNPG